MHQSESKLELTDTKKMTVIRFQVTLHAKNQHPYFLLFKTWKGDLTFVLSLLLPLPNLFSLLVHSAPVAAWPVPLECGFECEWSRSFMSPWPEPSGRRRTWCFLGSALWTLDQIPSVLFAVAHDPLAGRSFEHIVSDILRFSSQTFSGALRVALCPSSPPSCHHRCRRTSVYLEGGIR